MEPTTKHATNNSLTYRERWLNRQKMLIEMSDTDRVLYVMNERMTSVDVSADRISEYLADMGITMSTESVEAAAQQLVVDGRLRVTALYRGVQ